MGQIEYDFLDFLQSNKINVDVYLLSGIRLHGRIHDFDDNVLIFKNQKQSQIVYKTAIASILVGE